MILLGLSFDKCRRFTYLMFKTLQAVGISVEFCSHLVHTFAVSVESSRVKRSADALTKMGSSVSIAYQV